MEAAIRLPLHDADVNPVRHWGGPLKLPERPNRENIIDKKLEWYNGSRAGPPEPESVVAKRKADEMQPKRAKSACRAKSKSFSPLTLNRNFGQRQSAD